MSETHMEQKIDLDALEAALAKATPGEIYLIENGGPGLDPDPNYWGIYKGNGGSFDGSDGFAITGFICEGDARFIVMAHNTLPALIAELRELRAREAHMRRFAESMAGDGHPVLMGFAYQVQAILGTHALPLPPAPEACP